MTSPLLPYRPEMARDAVLLWNAALGDTFPLRDVLFRQNTVDDPHFDPAGCWVARAPRGERLLGLCLAKIAREPLGTDGLLEDRGWVSVLVVHPSTQRRVIGTALLQQAEAFFRAQGRRRIVLGGDPAHFFPGVLAGTSAVAFFESRGYHFKGEAFDLGRSIREYRTSPGIHAVLRAHPELAVRPLRPDEGEALLAFLAAVFPGRWQYTVERFLAGGGPLTDIMGVVRGREVLGFAHLFHSRSRWIGPSIAWAGRDASRLGGLGPMGVDPALRGRGLGLALLDRAMAHLASLGVDEMVIDWTVLLEFYGKLGFVPRRHYRHGERTL